MCAPEALLVKLALAELYDILVLVIQCLSALAALVTHDRLPAILMPGKAITLHIGRKSIYHFENLGAISATKVFNMVSVPERFDVLPCNDTALTTVTHRKRCCIAVKANFDHVSFVGQGVEVKMLKRLLAIEAAETSYMKTFIACSKAP